MRPPRSLCIRPGSPTINRGLPMPILILLLFFAEIAILIKLGQGIGGAALLLEILATGLLGWVLLRRAGRAVRRPEELIALLTNPAHYFRQSSLSLVLAGVLLLVPGLLSDVVGIALAVRFFISGDRSRPRPSEPRDPDVIDVDYRVHDDDRSE